MFDTIIVGAGFAGAVFARELVEKHHQTVLIIEQRSHIAGNCFDVFDNAGVMIHQYGPHIFHTDQKAVWDYVSRFTEWIDYQHTVLGVVDGRLVPIPFNLNTIMQVFPSQFAQSLTEKLVAEFGFHQKIPIIELINHANPDFKLLADYIYENVFLHYTLKQWGKDPKDLDPAIFHRVPVYLARDDRYFQDRYQGMPKYGYTRLFEQLLAHPNIKVLQNTNAKELITLDDATQTISFMGQPFIGKVVYTGLLDELFDFRFGELAYRSLKFDYTTLPQVSFQPAAVVNYPNNYDFTRITEYKKLTGQTHSFTTIAREYPGAYKRGDSCFSTPYYPVFTKESQAQYDQYRSLAGQFLNLTIVGRLAEYKYYDMDDIIARVLSMV